MFFPHSHIPELNQLTIPFLSLVSNAELNRNPTTKEEITASGQSVINAGMYTYPVHQAADILFCKSDVVPVGKDQLPHIEMARTITKRFNTKFKTNVFKEPIGLLSETPVILGIDGSQKMSKSRNIPSHFFCTFVIDLQGNSKNLNAMSTITKSLPTTIDRLVSCYL
ncbi:hypothetical protein [Sphingobacterium sp. UME9]|uniref:hypothetical protein n=1 Tax=Sphingobacterium sp. UME9 TaxID=1862316 RepID=UPI00287BC992|nr:hypothetical protein [Sphingobacterium sp. UME9]